MLKRLTKKEIDILKLVSEGLTNEEISEKHFISYNTIKTHLTSIYNKLFLSEVTKSYSVLRLRAALIYLKEYKDEKQKEN